MKGFTFSNPNDMAKATRIKLRRNTIQSEQKFESLGFGDADQYKFYELVTYAEGTHDEGDGAYMISISLDDDILEHKRSIYTLWDMLGDIGGLFDMLKVLTYIPLSFSGLLLGSGIDQTINESLFSV